MSWLAGFLAFLFLLGGVRNRVRLRRIPVLPPADGWDTGDFRFLVAPGVSLDRDTRRRAVTYARAAELEVLDLIPERWPALEAIGLAEILDYEKWRANRLAPGLTAGHAVLVSEGVLARISLDVRPYLEAEGEGEGVEHGEPGDLAGFVRVAARLRRYAPTATGIAVAPGAASSGARAAERFAVLKALFGETAKVVLALQLFFYALIGLCLWLTPWWGLAALVCFHLQIAMALLGLGWGQRGVFLAATLRLPLELYRWASTILAAPAPVEPPEVTRLRQLYDTLAAGGVDRFLGPRRPDCPLCGAVDLCVHLHVPDWFQHKSGMFTLTRCASCDHVFQNPQLTPVGLDYYYRDFYDGLGEDELEFVFGYNPGSYVERARTVEGFARPKRWLDVGGGHGHLCLMAREVFPQARFECLDQAESAEEAVRRGWADRAWRGFFPALVDEILTDAEAGGAPVDVVSMSHYLEHTPDPLTELDCAAQVLGEGGHLLIELPDPECPFGRWLGWAWLPWFQPQHLHFLRIDGLQRLLRERGFEPVRVLRAEAHQKADFTYAVLMSLKRLSAPVDVPWRPPSTRWQRLWRDGLWIGALPLLFAGLLLDQLSALFVRRRGLSNTYRVLARRTA